MNSLDAIALIYILFSSLHIANPDVLLKFIKHVTSGRIDWTYGLTPFVLGMVKGIFTGFAFVYVISRWQSY
ncbi:MAG: hypothetical protein ICV54_05225 [Nostoc sp. C3-bin3]|nr:hypothetical protein [Nostoc sp. C3-bin3]